MDFETLAQAYRKQKKIPIVAPDAITLCFDPGHTTGFAVFQGLELSTQGEIDTSDIQQATSVVGDCITLASPQVVVIEDYRIYKWRAKHHVGSDMLTTRVIGCIETLCIMNGISHIIKQPAHIAKGFCTDARLREWGFYRKGQKHARDAVRHGCYFLAFGSITRKQQVGSTVG